jgi:hypothetical protein
MLSHETLHKALDEVGATHANADSAASATPSPTPQESNA